MTTIYEALRADHDRQRELDTGKVITDEQAIELAGAYEAAMAADRIA